MKKRTARAALRSLCGYKETQRYSNGGIIGWGSVINGVKGYYNQLRAIDAIGDLDPQSKTNSARNLRIVRNGTVYTMYCSYDRTVWALTDGPRNLPDIPYESQLLGFSTMNDTGFGTPPWGAYKPREPQNAACIRIRALFFRSGSRRKCRDHIRSELRAGHHDDRRGHRLRPHRRGARIAAAGGGRRRARRGQGHRHRHDRPAGGGSQAQVYLTTKLPQRHGDSDIGDDRHGSAVAPASRRRPRSRPPSCRSPGLEHDVDG